MLLHLILNLPRNTRKLAEIHQASQKWITLASKLEKSAKPPPEPNGSEPPKASIWGFLNPGGWIGRGGAGLGGGCLLFLGGSAGLGLVGLGGGGPEPSRVGACKIANGSQPNGSLLG